MSYGLQFVNNSDVVTLDSEFSRLVVLSRGRWSAAGDQAAVIFPVTITSAEPPLVFLRPDSTTTISFCRIIGSAGAWTGFYTRVSGAGSYFCAAFKASPVSDYGLRLWGADATLLFDSGNPCAQFTRTISSWTYIGSGTGGQGDQIRYFSAPSDLSTGDYILINNIAMNVGQAQSRDAKLYCSWEYNNNRIVMYTAGVTPIASLFVPVVFAKPIP